MTLTDSTDTLFLSENLEVKGFGFAGTFNIEGGFAEFRTGYFGRCERCLEEAVLIHDCSICGRKPGNNVSFLSGRGDGVYSGVSVYGDDGLTLLGVAYIFDEDNRFSELIVQQFRDSDPNDINFQILLALGIGDFRELEPYFAGKINCPANGGLLVGDQLAGENDNFAVVDHLFSERQTYSVFLFMEPLLDSPTVAAGIGLGASPESYNGGFEGSMRPRVVLLIQEEQANKVVQLSEKSKGFEWERQCESWNNGTVTANVGGQKNGEVAMLVNANFWEITANRQLGFNQKFEGVVHDLWVQYAKRCVSWNAQAALLGNKVAISNLDNLSSTLQGISENKLLNSEFVEEALKIRGWSYDEESKSKIDGIVLSRGNGLLTKSSKSIGSTSNFCGNCGHKYAIVEAKFCPTCGEKRT
jgi:hypothetical protein